MNLFKVLFALLVGSALALSTGGVMLYWYRLVPSFLIELTAIAVIVLLILSYPVLRQNRIAIEISTALGVLAPLISLSTPAHVAVLLSFGYEPLLTVLASLQFLGFYIFPISFVILRIVERKTIVSRKKYV